MAISGELEVKFGDLPLGSSFKDHPKSIIIYCKESGYSATIIKPGKPKTVYFGINVIVYRIED